MKRYIIVAALAGLGAGAAWNEKKPPERIEARTLVLVDEAGRKRGEMAMGKNGDPFVRLYDAEGKVIWDTDARFYLLQK